MFDYALPKPPLALAADKKKPKDGKPEKKPAKPKEKGPLRTQMLGETRDDELGYDPAKIPVEEIPDD